MFSYWDISCFLEEFKKANVVGFSPTQRIAGPVSYKATYPLSVDQGNSYYNLKWV